MTSLASQGKFKLMKKPFSVFFVFLVLFFLFVSSANASLVVVDSVGRVIWKVLSSQDSLALDIAKRGEIEVKEAAGGETETNIALKKDGERFFLNELEVTGWKDSLVEIEERGEVKEILIATRGDKFAIEQNGIVALTDSSINIRPKENELSITTDSGATFLSILPVEAAESALRSRFISRIKRKEIYLSKEEVGVLAYRIEGEKVFNFFNLFEYKIPVTAHISASTGEILAVEGPEWFKIFSFLFT